MDNDVCKIEDFFSPSVNSQRMYGIGQSQKKTNKHKNKQKICCICETLSEKQTKKNGC